MSNKHNIPPNGVFYFENFDGFSNKNSIIQHIKQQAFLCGTVLSVHKVSKQSTKQPFYSITLACNHFGTQKKTNTSVKKFEIGYVQASSTIIQQPHAASSISGRSRNSTFKRINSIYDSNNNLCKQN